MKTDIPTLAVRCVSTEASVVDELVARRLKPEERALLSERASLKRRAEFVAGRVAARAAVSRLLATMDSVRDFSVLREGDGPTGRPRVVIRGGDVAPEVSISHADGLAVAAAFPHRVGVDIATIQGQDPSFVRETFGEVELASWSEWLDSPGESPITITTAFAAKEAALKWLGTGLALPLRAIEVVPNLLRCQHIQTASNETSCVLPVSLIDHAEAHRYDLIGRFVKTVDKVIISLFSHCVGTLARARCVS